ncbi:MAG: hypothetical protein C0399_06095 [Syntrophus sp. (in: bacteria)]|nr:hypothetical protein [Syntrophus sp. (in: bacteria)]
MNMKTELHREMKSQKITGVLIAALLFCASFAIASSVFALTPPVSKKPGKTETLTGKVSEANIDAQTIVVMSKNAGVTLETTSAKFKGYQTIRGIKVGDKVMVTYEIKEGKAYAKVITKRKSVTKTSNSKFLSFKRT